MDELNSEEQETVLLPLFPLRLVLFPGQILPLHVFEPRYRLMISHCVEQQEPFGVVLMREDTPDWRSYEGDIALPYEVGTTAHIRQVERLPDGRLNIVTVGLHRFRIRKLRFDMPYLQAEVEAFPLEEEDQAIAPAQVAGVRRLLKSYMTVLSQIVDAEIDADEMPEDARTLAFLTANALQIPWDDKQKLLALPDLATLLQVERRMLGRETMLLQFMQDTEDQLEGQVVGPSGYLYPN
jgi:Lon protease-like protein